MSRTIRIDEEVYQALKRRAEPFEDSPNDVLRRLLDLNGASPQSRHRLVTPTNSHTAAIIDDPVMLIKIARNYKRGMSDAELYAVTRYAWRVAPKQHNARFACAVFEGVVLEIYEIHQWRIASPPKGETWDGERWEFDGVPAEDGVRLKYRGHRVDSFFPHGAQNPIRYVNC